MPTVDCRSSEYIAFRPVVITILCVFIIGMPMVILAFLRKQKRNDRLDKIVENDTAAAAAAGGGEHNSPNGVIGSDNPIVDSRDVSLHVVANPPDQAAAASGVSIRSSLGLLGLLG